MGMMHHVSMIVTSFDDKKLARTHKKAKSLFKSQDVSRIMGQGVNGYKSFVIVPCGSKLGWEPMNNQLDAVEKLKEWIDESMPYDDGSTSVQYVINRFGEFGLQSEDHDGNMLDSEEVKHGQGQRSDAV